MLVEDHKDTPLYEPAENDSKPHAAVENSTNEDAAEQVATKTTHVIERSEKRRHRSSKDVVGAIFLIFLGSMFFLNTTGLVSWSIWGYVWRFWPAILVLIGVQMLLGRSFFSNLVVGLITIGLFGAIVITALIGSGSSLVQDLNIQVPEWWLNAAQQSNEKTTEQVTVAFADYEEIERVDFNLDIGAAEFTMENQGEEILMLDATFHEGFGAPDITEKEAKGILAVNFEQASGSFVGLPIEAASYDFLLGASELETNIDIELGAGQGTIEFSEQKINDFAANVGAGQMSVTLEVDALPTGTLDLEVGAGQLELTIPDGVGLQVNYDLGVGSIEIDNQDIGNIGADGQFLTEKFKAAENQLTLNVKVGVGQFTLTRSK